MKKFKIKTLGCKVNQFESDVIRKELGQSAWTDAGTAEPDIYIINTCTVTGKASMQSRQAIRQAVRNHPGARIVVTGCYAQTAPEEIKAIAGVDTIVGHSHKYDIPDLLAARPAPFKTAPTTRIANVFQESIFKQPQKNPESNRTRPFLKIQDGCNAFCTYCIVPHARGKSRSMPMSDVIGSIKRFCDDGYREIVLTGINLGAYGRDLAAANGGLADLLQKIEDNPVINRVRLSSIEPLELNERIIKLVASSKIICNHFHIPLQSGDNRILKRMHRPYTAEQFSTLVDQIYQSDPDTAIGADVLIGFPGETGQAFDATKTLIESLPLAYLHVFPFSPRPGTPAATFTEQIPPDVIKARCEVIREIGRRKQKTFGARFIGRTLPVLVETKRTADGRKMKGVTPNYLTVLFDGDDSLGNRIVTVSIDSLGENRSVFGTQV